MRNRYGVDCYPAIGGQYFSTRQEYRRICGIRRKSGDRFYCRYGVKRWLSKADRSFLESAGDSDYQYRRPGSPKADRLYHGFYDRRDQLGDRTGGVRLYAVQ